MLLCLYTEDSYSSWGVLTVSHGNSDWLVYILANTHAGVRAVHNILSLCFLGLFLFFFTACLVELMYV